MKKIIYPYGRYDNRENTWRNLFRRNGPSVISVGFHIRVPKFLQRFGRPMSK